MNSRVSADLFNLAAAVAAAAPQDVSNRRKRAPGPTVGWPIVASTYSDFK